MLQHIQASRRVHPLLVIVTGLLVIAAAYVWILRTSTPTVALDNLSGEEVMLLVIDQHPNDDVEICVQEETSDFAAQPHPHGITTATRISDEIHDLLEQRYALADDHEHRHLEGDRLLLVSWDTTTRDRGVGASKELGSVFEFHHLKDDQRAFWEVAYTGTMYECSAED